MRRIVPRLLAAGERVHRKPDTNFHLDCGVAIASRQLHNEMERMQVMQGIRLAAGIPMRSPPHEAGPPVHSHLVSPYPPASSAAAPYGQPAPPALWPAPPSPRGSFWRRASLP